MMLKTNSTKAAKRVPRPSTSSTGKNSSTPVPRKAASCGGSSGTAYSFSNSETVLDQLAILVRPAWKKTTATNRRTARSASGAPKPRTRPTRLARAARRTGSAPAWRGSVASRVAGGMAFSFEKFGRGGGRWPATRKARRPLQPQLFLTAAAPPWTFSGLLVSFPPAILSQVPVGTRIQASASRSAVALPAHALLLVPQSFLPALTMPAHFSVSPLAASAIVLAAPRPTAMRLARVPRTREFVGVFMGFSVSVVGVTRNRIGAAGIASAFPEKKCRQRDSRAVHRMLTFRSHRWSGPAHASRSRVLEHMDREAGVRVDPELRVAPARGARQRLEARQAV